MVVLNDMDRFHLVADVIDRVPSLRARAAYAKQAIARQADRAQAVHRPARRRHARDPGVALGRRGHGRRARPAGHRRGLLTRRLGLVAEAQPRTEPRGLAMSASDTVGRSAPLGATVGAGGVNFSVFSRQRLRRGPAALRPGRRRPTRAGDSPRSRRQPHLPLLARASCRAWSPGRSTPIGPRDRRTPRAGCDSIPDKVLLDPYGRGVVVPRNYSRAAARQRRATTPPRP